MKEQYFTNENIQVKSAEIISFVEKVLRKKSFDFDVNKAALLVLDMQEYFVNEESHAFVPSAKAILPNIQKLVEKFNKSQRPVIFTKHINTAENAKMMGVWWKELITKDKTSSKICSAFNVDSSLVMEKSQYDAFYETELEKLLREKGVEQVVITGVMAHLCCETTARAAFVRGFLPFFVVDATASYNEEFHKSTILNLAHGFAIPCFTKQICKLCHPELDSGSQEHSLVDICDSGSSPE